MKLRHVAWGLCLLALAASASAQTRKGYVIQLADPPAATYAGGVAGLAATRPAAGSKLKVGAADVQAYLRYLDGKQSQVAAAVPAAQVYYRYGAVFNGFAAKLTDAEFQKLVGHPGVKAITVDEARPLDTNYTPGFLGLNQPGGAWSRTDANGRSIKGENVIIGHIDTGVWPEDPSFSDKVDPLSGKPVPYFMPGTVVYDPLPAGRWNGICQAGEGFNASLCNNKLIGARFYTAGFDASGQTLWQNEYRSPRDEDGHGSHTLSTAGGNQNADVSVFGTPINGISGMAPRARVAMYKACYTNTVNGARGQGACFSSDTVAAINQAVADGVDVINYSISGSQTTFLDAVEVAFFNAMAAGVFVSASAGNSGPGNTVAHISPWLITVGNSTHDRFTVATVTLGDGNTALGPSFQTQGVSAKPLIAAPDAGVLGADATLLARCYGPADGQPPFDAQVIVPGHGAHSTRAREDLTLTREYLAHLRRTMGEAARNMEPFDDAYARTDWSRFQALPLFEAANRVNAYNTYLLMEREGMTTPRSGRD